MMGVLWNVEEAVLAFYRLILGVKAPVSHTKKRIERLKQT